MKITLISCWRRRYYADYVNNLRHALEAKIGKAIKIVTSNCGCSPPWYLSKEDLIDTRCDYFNMPNISYCKSSKKWKYLCRMYARRALSSLRGLYFSRKSKGADIIHFQQVLNAFGFTSVYYFLKTVPKNSGVIVTLHEIDPFQNDFPRFNKIYNKADKVIVHFEDIKKYLINNGVQEEKVVIINNGVQIPRLYNYKREGIIFHGGTHLTSGKGLEDLFNALKILKSKGREHIPLLKVYGFYDESEEQKGIKLAKDIGVHKFIKWLEISGAEFRDIAKVNEEYQKSMICVLPYTKGTAGYQASLAMANALPVVATRAAGIFDHLGDTGIYVKEKSPEGISEALEKLLNNQTLKKELGQQARERAEGLLNWNVIADKTYKLYEEVLKRR